MVDGQSVGLVSATQIFGGSVHGAAAEPMPVVVLADRFTRYGLVVERFLGERDLVVRPLDPRLGKVKDIAAAAVTEDGSIMLIVDVEDLIGSIDNLLAGGQRCNPVADMTKTAARRRKRVLVVDDSLTVREVERKLLENHGYEVVTAVDGLDGWSAVLAGNFDLVISDVDMPRLNGVELVSCIRHEPRLQLLPVLLVSYKDREEDRRRGLEAGANYYLAKSSFHDEVLLGAVVDLIGEANA
jgi:two-component system sensor histidine kinase and response regulator WspE